MWTLSIYCGSALDSASLSYCAANIQVTVEVPLVEAGHMSPEDYVIAVECVSGESVCLATRNGDILLYNIQTRHVR